MIALEKALPLAEAAKQWLPPSRTGKPIAPSVLWRWAENGILVNGRRVKLSVVRIGGQRYVDRESLQRFLGELNDGPREASPLPESPDDPPKQSAARQAREAVLAMT